LSNKSWDFKRTEAKEYGIGLYFDGITGKLPDIVLINEMGAFDI
jgi:hypothetical protein